MHANFNPSGNSIPAGVLGSRFSFLESKNPMNQNEKSVRIPIRQITAGFNYRRRFNKTKMDELVEDIKRQGLLQDILIRPLNGAYQVVAGHRRLRAVELAFGEEAEIGAMVRIMIAIENKGTSSDWVVYYKMAQEAIKGTLQGNRTEDFTWLKNNLLYHEATAPSLLMLEDNLEELDSYLTYIDTLDDMPEAYMGICKSIYRINNDIFRLSRKLVNSKSFDVVEEVCREAEVLEQRIEHCQTLEPTEEMVVNGTLVYHQMFFSVLKDTARLYIRQCVHMVASVSTKSTMLVSRIIRTIRELFGTVIDSALLFPLFILGVDTVASDARAWVIRALYDLHKRVGSGNILVAIELLQKIWDRNNEGRIHVLWTQVAMEHGLLVSLA
jgi:hypothetical protein